MPTPLNPKLSPDYGLIDMPDLETSEICRSLYSNFYANITSSQNNDATISLDTRIRNTSYNLASPIARHIGSGGGGGTGGSGGGVDPGLFVSKSGDTMSGKLSTLYGFAAGENGQVMLQTKKTTYDTGVTENYISVEGKLSIDSSNLLIDNKVLFNHYIDIIGGSGENLEINGGNTVSFKTSDLKTEGELIANKFVTSNTSFTYDNHKIFHAGNSNRQEIDWTSYNANIYGSLIAKGNSRFDAKLTALFDVELGSSGSAVAVVSQNKFNFYKPINLTGSSPIQLGEIDIIKSINNSNIQVSAANGSLILGGNNTSDIRLWSTIKTEQGDQDMIDKFGNAWFLSSFTAGYGKIKLLSTNTDEVVIHNKLKFENNNDTYLTNDSFGVQMSTTFSKSGYQNTHKTSINIGESTSIHTDVGRKSESVFINTTADFFTFNKPIEAYQFVGIQGSTTRLLNNTLFFTNEHFLINIPEGIKHYGNSYFTQNLSSERFSTGFAGEGWAIRKKVDSGNIELTVDEVVVRKKIRAYEFDVQKINIVNGSLWISNSCSADNVTIIN